MPAAIPRVVEPLDFGPAAADSQSEVPLRQETPLRWLVICSMSRLSASI